MSKQSNIPQLRFKGFDGEWENKSMSDICKINQGLQIPISERFYEKSDDNYFYITNEFLRKDSAKSYFIKNPSKSVICYEDDILMTRTGNTGQVVTGVHGAFHNNFFKIKYDENCNKWFLYFFLTSYKTQGTILKLAGTSTIPDLNHGDFYKIKINIPTVPEQEKIASFLSAVDEKIQQLTHKAALLEQYKKGVMQQLFSGKLRFKDENGEEYADWEEKKLGEVATKKSSNISANKIEENFGDFIIYGASGILKKVDFYKEENDYISIVKDGAGVGRLLFCKGKSSVLGTMEIISPKQNIDTYFLFCLLSNIDFTKYITGSTIPHIYFKDYSIENCGIPSLPEQQKIAGFLSGLDEKIGVVQGELLKMQGFKKGLLQQMFV